MISDLHISSMQKALLLIRAGPLFTSMAPSRMMPSAISPKMMPGTSLALTV